jgi:hypothetical protein
MSQNPILKAGSASDVTNRNKGRVEYGNILGQQMAVEAGILPSVTLQKGGGGSASSRVASILGASVVTAAERTTAVTNLVSNISINAATAVRLSAAARGKFGITNVPGTATTAAAAAAAPVDLFTATGTYTTFLANGRKYYRFTGNGTVVVGAAAATVEYFAVGGGGGGGGGSGDIGGGGGAGGLQTNSSTYATASQVASISALAAGATYTVTIGNGGQFVSGSNTPGMPYIAGAVGQNTTFTGTGVSISATGGGGGKGSGGGGAQNAKGGGSGGGGWPQDGLSFLGIGTQGFNGFNSGTPGGGGGGGIGASATSVTTGGVGLTYPTGGLTYGAGGAGGGGTTASANTGNGGGGANPQPATAGSGGSGIFIISYPF